MKRHTGSQFARDLEYIPRVSAIGGWKCSWIHTNRLELNNSSQQMTTRHTGCQFARHLKNILQVSLKGGCKCCWIDMIQLELNWRTHHNKWWPVILDVDLQDTANWHLVWWIVICWDELFDSSWIMSNHQHLLHCTVYNILMIDFQLFYALRMWKVHVVMFLYHVTHFHSLLTCAPLNFRYVNARFNFWHTMVISHIAYAFRLVVC